MFSSVLPLEAFSEKKGSYLNYKKDKRELKNPYENMCENTISIDKIIRTLKDKSKKN